jgi:dTDP-4-dehydrorhamnose 3,5-epimerase
MIDLTPLTFPDVLLIRTKRFGDARGFFTETYNRQRFAGAGIDYEFVQDNHSMSAERGTVRGLHFQVPPFAQAKLVRVTRGAIVDVIVDVRRQSPTFGKWISVKITAEGGEQILLPEGYAHGFCTLEPNTEVIYKVSCYYSPEHELGIRWNDPALGIAWPVAGAEAVLSDRDSRHPLLKDSPCIN